MALREFFSKRAAKQAKGNTPDVYQYDNLPPTFRVQIVHIWQRAMAGFSLPTSMRASGPPTLLSQIIERDVAEEHGLFELGEDRDAFTRLANYFLKLGDEGKAL